MGTSQPGAQRQVLSPETPAAQVIVSFRPWVAQSRRQRLIRFWYGTPVSRRRRKALGNDVGGAEHEGLVDRSPMQVSVGPVEL